MVLQVVVDPQQFGRRKFIAPQAPTPRLTASNKTMAESAPANEFMKVFTAHLLFVFAGVYASRPRRVFEPETGGARPPASADPRPAPPAPPDPPVGPSAPGFG